MTTSYATQKNETLFKGNIIIRLATGFHIDTVDVNHNRKCVLGNDQTPYLFATLASAKRYCEKNSS